MSFKEFIRPHSIGARYCLYFVVFMFIFAILDNNLKLASYGILSCFLYVIGNAFIEDKEFIKNTYR
jgi:hypothetical protein